MTRKDCQQPAMEKCRALGLHPIADPLGEEDHHTDRPFTDEDREIGDALAYFLGGLFVDKDGGLSPERPYNESYFYNEMTSVDVWARVARALRIHGLAIADRR